MTGQGCLHQGGGKAAPNSEARYTHGHERAVLQSHGERTAANSAAYLLPHLRQGMSVLDVGCGPGSITLDLAETVAPGRAIGVDAIDAPLETARAKAAERGDSLTTFTRGDIMALDYPDHSFDVVHAHQVLQHLSNPIGAMREMLRVCKPGGIVAARDADYGGMFWYPELSELEQWRVLYHEIARANGGEPDAARHMRSWAQEAVEHMEGNSLRFSGAVTAPVPGSALDQPSEGAGNRDNRSSTPRIEVSSSTWIYATPESAEHWGRSQANRIGGQTFRKQAAQFGLTERDVDAIAHAWRTWGASPDATFVIPHVEILIHL